MSNEHQEDSGSGIFIITFFIGLYIFFTGFLRGKVTSTWNIFLGCFCIIIIESLGVMLLLHAVGVLGKKNDGGTEGVVVAMGVFFVLYILTVIKAYSDNRKYTALLYTHDDDDDN